MKSFTTLLFVAFLMIGCEQGTNPIDSQNLPADLPPGPAIVAAEIISATAVRITWADTTSGVREYELWAQWGEDTTFYPIQRVAGSEREVVWEGCDRPTVYRVKVRSVLARGFSEASSPCEFIRIRRPYSIDFAMGDFPTLTDLQLSIDGELIAVCDGELQVRETITGRLVWSRNLQTNELYSAAFIPGTGHIAVAGERSIDILSASDGAIIRSISPTHGLISQILASPDGESLVVTGTEGLVEVHWLENNRVVVLQTNIDEPFFQHSVRCAISPTGEYILISRIDHNSTVVRRFGTWESVTELPGYKMSFTSDGERLAICGQTGRTTIYNTNNWSKTGEIASNGVLQFSPDGKYLIFATHNVLVFNSLTGTQIANNLTASLPGVVSDHIARQFDYLNFSRDGRFLVGVHFDITEELFGVQRITLWI